MAKNVTVKIAGTSGKVQVEVKDNSTVADVLTEAALILGVDKEVVNQLAPVVNGQTATGEDTVPDGAQVAAAPKLRNGSRSEDGDA